MSKRERNPHLYSLTLLWKSLRYLSDGLRICPTPSSLEWRLTSKLEWKSSSRERFDLSADRRVTVQISDVQCPNNSQQDSNIMSCYHPSRDELLSPSLKSYESSRLDCTMTCQVTEERQTIDQTRWFPVTRRDVLDANTVIHRWSMSTGIFLSYPIDLFEGELARESSVCRYQRLWANRWCFCNKFQVDAIESTASNKVKINETSL